jgi:anti-anti-sigma factor
MCAVGGWNPRLSFRVEWDTIAGIDSGGADMSKIESVFPTRRTGMTGDLKIEQDRKGEVKILRLHGEVNHHNAQYLDDSLEEHVEENERVVLDLRDLSLITSPGLGLLIKHTERLRDPDKIVLAGLQPRVQEVFRALGLDQFFQIFETEAEAFDFIAAHPASD